MKKIRVSLFLVLLSASTVLAGALDVVKNLTENLEQATALHDVPNVNAYAEALAGLVMTGDISKSAQPTYKGTKLLPIKAANYGMRSKKATPEEKAVIHKALDALATLQSLSHDRVFDVGSFIEQEKSGKQHSAHRLAAYNYFVGQKDALKKGGALPLFDLYRAASDNISAVEHKRSTYSGVIYIANLEPLQQYSKTHTLHQLYPWIKTMHLLKGSRDFTLPGIKLISEEAKNIKKDILAKLSTVTDVSIFSYRSPQYPDFEGDGLGIFVERVLKIANDYAAPELPTTLKEVEVMLQVLPLLNKGIGKPYLQRELATTTNLSTQPYYSNLKGTFDEAINALRQKKEQVEFLVQAKQSIQKILAEGKQSQNTRPIVANNLDNLIQKSYSLTNLVQNAHSLANLVQVVVATADNYASRESRATSKQIEALLKILPLLNEGFGKPYLQSYLQEKINSYNDYIKYSSLGGTFDKAMGVLGQRKIEKETEEKAARELLIQVKQKMPMALGPYRSIMKALAYDLPSVVQQVLETANEYAPPESFVTLEQLNALLEILSLLEANVTGKRYLEDQINSTWGYSPFRKYLSAGSSIEDVKQILNQKKAAIEFLSQIKPKIREILEKEKQSQELIQNIENAGSLAELIQQVLRTANDYASPGASVTLEQLNALLQILSLLNKNKAFGPLPTNEQRESPLESVMKTLAQKRESLIATK